MNNTTELRGDALKHATALSVAPETAHENRTAAARDTHWLEQNIPCQKACPAGTDIPGYLEAIYHGDFARAYEINLRDNVFPAVLGRVCSRPCEPACRHGWEGNGEPVAICFSKRSAADFREQAPVVLPRVFPESGKRVAVIGAGVAGLAAARELALWGHAVVVLEKHSTPGGMLNQGIPIFRLPREWIAREIAQIRALGVDIRCGVDVGGDTTLAQLLGEHDAVVMAAGTLRPNVLPLPGAQFAGVEHGLKFLLEVNEFGRTKIGGKIVVIGGGYTALDCSRTALRLGAEVAVHYRRGREDMVVLPGEVEEFQREGGGLENHCTPVAIVGKGGKVGGVRFARTRAGTRGADGRRAAETISGSEFEVACDSVILATGQFPKTDWIDPDLRARLVAADEWLSSGANEQTAQAKLFVAGDFALGATTLISAIGHAKACARKVDAFLMGANRFERGVRVSPSFQSKSPKPRTTRRSADMNMIPLHLMPTLAPARRNLSAEVEQGFDQATAKREASRCYLCHYKFEIIDSKCVLCDECLNVKPVAGCIVEVSALIGNGDGAIVGHQPIERGATDSLYYNRLWIDQNQCIRCGACEAVCPVNAITIQKVHFA
jgi:NADPH-dependent glutamate synthase beta subunit-like oxidoreductase/ferredoxin